MKVYTIHNHSIITKIVFHIGLGLVGTAIRNSLYCKYKLIEEKNFKIDWSKLESDFYLISLIQNIESYILSKNVIKYSTTVIISSGKIGFNSDSDEVNHEVKIFSQLLQIFSKLIDAGVVEESLKLILISSAGGLFEGQININHSSTVNPKRPYGIAKLEMENELINNRYFKNYHILRLSSVYSSKSVHKRLGLIAVLISNGIRNYSTSIYGNMNTLRDYIYDEDIGNYVATLVSSKAQKSIEFVVSGFPITIFQLKNMVERIIQKRLYVQFVNSENAANITFDNSTLPLGLNITQLEVCIKRLYNTVVESIIYDN